MIGRRPETIDTRLMDIAESPLGIAGRIGPPPGKLPAAPLTVTAAVVGNHQAVSAIAEQHCPRQLGVGGGNGGARRRDQIDRQELRFALADRDKVNGRQGRDAFLEKSRKGADPWITVETARERIVLEKIDQGEKGHALVVGHIGLDDDTLFQGFAGTIALRLPAEVHCLEVAVIAK